MDFINTDVHTIIIVGKIEKLNLDYHGEYASTRFKDFQILHNYPVDTVTI